MRGFAKGSFSRKTKLTNRQALDRKVRI